MKQQISLSVSSASTDAFISTLLFLLLDLENNDVEDIRADLKQWYQDSNEFLDTFKYKKAYAVIINPITLGQKFEGPEKVQDLLAFLKVLLPKLDKDNTISREQLKLIRDINTNIRTQSMRSWENIHKNVTILGNPKLNIIFMDPYEDSNHDSAATDDAAKAMFAAVKKLTGKDGYFLNIKQVMEYSKTKPLTYAKYSPAVKIINAAVKKEILKYVRSSGKQLVSIDDLKEHLRKIGLVNNLPTGFTGGMMDEKGLGYTKEGRQLDRAPFGHVVMNPKYDPEKDNTYVMHSPDDRIKYRTLTFTGGNKAQKYEQVLDFIANEEKLRKMWLSDLDTPGRPQIFAAMVELLYSSALRIGGEGNATAGEPTYGLSTIQVQHVTVKANQIELSFVGKKSAMQNAIYMTNTPVAKKVGAIIRNCLKGKQPADLVFTHKNKPLKRAAVNLYLKSLGIQLSSHKFRHIAGTKMAMAILKKAPFKAGSCTQAAVQKWIKTEFEAIGKHLHHSTGEKVTSSTALKSYIEPSMLIKYFEDLGLRKPNWAK